MCRSGLVAVAMPAWCYNVDPNLWARFWDWRVWNRQIRTVVVVVVAVVVVAAVGVVGVVAAGGDRGGGGGFDDDADDDVLVFGRALHVKVNVMV